jgi:hypothetical protein
MYGLGEVRHAYMGLLYMIMRLTTALQLAQEGRLELERDFAGILARTSRDTSYESSYPFHLYGRFYTTHHVYVPRPIGPTVQYAFIA